MKDTFAYINTHGEIVGTSEYLPKKENEKKGIERKCLRKGHAVIGFTLRIFFPSFFVASERWMVCIAHENADTQPLAGVINILFRELK